MTGLYDIIPFPNKINTLFILESPHIKEIEFGYPAAGQSGKNMSRIILGNNHVPFGKLLNDKATVISEYGIFNSCQFPLGIPEKLSGLELKISGIKKIYQSKNRFDNYKRLIEFLSEIENLEHLLKYKERLNGIIQNSPSIEYIVFCGFIAQAIFLKLYPSVSIPPYNKWVLLNSKRILFVNHPSELNTDWDYKNIDHMH